MSNVAFWTGLVVVGFLLALFLVSAFVLMLLVNVVLGHYDVKQLDYASALAITIFLWIFGGLFSNIGGK